MSTLDSARYLLTASLILGTTLSAQQPPLLRFQATANPGQTLQGWVAGLPLQTCATYADIGSGPLTLLGEPIWLSLSPALLQIDAGVLDASGARPLQVPTPNLAALVGQPFFLQSLVLDTAAPNGLFRTSNGQSSILHSQSGAIVFEFRDAAAEGVTGSYDMSVKDRLMAAPISLRTRTVAPASGLPFHLPLQTPLATTNSRMQHVYRAGDLGANGQPEVVTALRWRPFGPVVPDTFSRVQITLAHTTVVPDYTVDIFSGLPKYPNSGLVTTFANNYKPQEIPVVVTDGPYSILPSALRPDGFLPWPQLFRPFVYNGIDSLLIDYRVLAGATTTGNNGFAVRLMVTSSPDPNTRVYAPAPRQPAIDPFAITIAAQGDNTLYDLQIDFVDAMSTATTKWVRNPGPRNIYHPAMVAASLPPGTGYELWFQGATDQSGSNPTHFAQDPTGFTAHRWVRLQVRFMANPFDGAQPSIDTIVIPVD
jgi:hypothetical protein